ncbi:MAG: lipoprotein insertase outer membrane protein LolB [Povalibacter sp.]
MHRRAESRALFAALSILVALSFLSGCATQAPRPQQPVPQNLSELNGWQARGRIGVSGGQGGGSGSFDWQQQGEHADVQIRGPVGIGSVQLQVDGSAQDPEVKLRTADGTTLESQDAWNELEARLGAPVPAGNLRFWMLGIAAPGEHEWHQADAQGVTALDQGGWRIEYQQFSETPGARVPTKISAASGATRVRIVIDRWQLGSLK